MPAPARKNTTEIKDPTPDTNNTPEDTENPDTTDGDNVEKGGPQEEETNPVIVPDDWEKVPDEQGGGIKPTTVPWAGYENA